MTRVFEEGSVQDQIDRFRAEHEALETRLKVLDGHVYLSGDEQVERKQIQKKKLWLKDRIARLQRSAS